MREDMDKVIVERPRRGGGGKARVYRGDLEDAPIKEGMRRPHADRKGLNENLAPLVKFLRKSVGRPWNKVYSEISENLSRSSTVQAHVFQHLKDLVEMHPLMVDGVPYRITYGGAVPLYTDRFGRDQRLYVCPKTGILKVARPFKGKKKAPPETVVYRTGKYEAAVRACGTWLLCTLRSTALIAPDCTDANTTVDDCVFGRLSLYETKKIYGCYLHAVDRRPMERGEITYALTCKRTSGGAL